MQELEFQVLADPEGGEPVEDRRGIYSDGVTEWWSIRCPRHADSEPDFNDYELEWRLDQHALSIGFTGWNWVQKQSVWLGFDFDALTGHAEGVGLTDEQLREIQRRAMELDYVEVVRSTSGKGLHLYVYLEDGFSTENHTEHAALARAVIGVMSTECNFDLAADVDCMGSVLWKWSKNQSKNAFEVVKGSTRKFRLDELPENWKDNVSETTAPEPTDDLNAFQRLIVTECKLVKDGDWYHGHVAAIQDGLDTWGLTLNLPTGRSDLGKPNCYARFNGDSLFVKRFGSGEYDSIQLLTRLEDLFRHAGVPRGEKGYQLTVEQADRLLPALYATIPDVPDFQGEPRQIFVSPRGENDLLVVISRHGTSDGVPGYVSKPTDRIQSAVVSMRQATIDTQESVRFLYYPDTDGDTDNQWQVRTASGDWIDVNQSSARNRIKQEGIGQPDEVMAAIQKRPLKVVCNHMQPVGPIGDELNLLGCRLPDTTAGPFTHYRLITEHLGQYLESGVRRSAWCQHYGVSGRDYIELYFAVILQNPYGRLPFLSCNSDETGSGKTKLRDIGIRTVGPHFCVDGGNEVGDKWSGHLRRALIVYYEEIDLRPFVEKLKDLTTSEWLTVRSMRQNQFSTRNATHSIHTSNDVLFAPIDYDDRRVVLFDPPPKPTEKVAENKLLAALNAEASHWQHHLLHLEVPPPDDDMDFLLPVIETDTKRKVMRGEWKSKPKDDLRNKQARELDDILNDALNDALTCKQIAELMTVEPKPTPRQVSVWMQTTDWEPRGSKPRKYYRPTGAKT